MNMECPWTGDHELHKPESSLKPKPELTLKELAVEYGEAHGVKVSHSTIARSLDRLAWTRKIRR